MPTNLYRKMPKKTAGASQNRGGADLAKQQGHPHRDQKPKIIQFTIGRTSFKAQLSDTPTAERFWRALPIFSVAETWGETIHFETPVPTGRDRTARINARPGDICFWTNDNRVIIAFGPSPISRPGEIRLPTLCNVFAKAMDDASVLKIVTPGEKVSVKAADNAHNIERALKTDN